MITSDKITLTVLGGGREIGANSYLLTWGRYRIVLDCGLDITKTGYNALPQFELLDDRDVDAAIITHSHIDHVGSLPILIDSYMRTVRRVFVTPPSKELIPIMLMDSSKKQDRIFLDEKPRYYRWCLDRMSVTDLLLEEGILTARNFHAEFEPVPGLKAKFFPAGHILGAAGVVITDGRYTFVYTGDIAKQDQASLLGCSLAIPENTDSLLIESTRGAIELPEGQTRRSEYLRLAHEINAALERSGHVLLPTFALGKSQDMFVMLSQMKAERLIHSDAPIFYHKGLTEFVTRKYLRFLGYLNGVTAEQLEKTATRINIFTDDDYVFRLSELTDRPSLFVFTSGMVSKGSPSARLAEEIVQKQENALLFTGYIAPEEFGYELANAPLGSYVEPERKRRRQIQINCPHRYRFSLSSHSDREDLIKIAETYKADRTIWIHGEQESTEWLSTQWLSKNPGKVALQPNTGETIILRQGKSSR